jgi:tRNA(fMet)-specific endonuclease VapC
MEPRFLLDTNTFIYIRRRRPPQVMARFDRLRVGETALSVVSYGELIFGIQKSASPTQEFAKLEEISALIPVLPLPAAAGPIYGNIRATLEARGETIGSNDFWIAAHAKALDLTLVTNNEREFRRVSGLKIENWFVGSAQFGN